MGRDRGHVEELRRRCCRCAPEGALAAAFPHTCTYRCHVLPPQPDSFATSRRSSPWLRGVAVAGHEVDSRRCTPEGTPAFRLLLRCAACCPCTTLVGMSPPMLRACSAACCLRCFAGCFHEMRACTRCDTLLTNHSNKGAGTHAVIYSTSRADGGYGQTRTVKLGS